MYACIKDQIQNMNLVIGCTVGCPYCYARNNVRRYHMIDDFSQPEFFPGKLRLMEKERPQNLYEPAGPAARSSGTVKLEHSPGPAIGADG